MLDAPARLDAPVRDAAYPAALPGGAAGRLAIAPAGVMDRLLLRGDAASLGTAFAIGLPTQPCRSAMAGGSAALWLGPDEWLLLGAPGTLDARAAVSGGAVVDVSHRQVGLVLAGPDAADALATGCPLDLHPAAFPPGACTRTVFGKAEIVLWRREASRFHVEAWRSFAGYVQERLGGAARELEACRRD